MRALSRDRWDRGFTLIEMLVVVMLIGFAAAIASIQLNKTWQRYRLDTTATDVRNLLQSAYVRMGATRAPVFVRLEPASGGSTAVLRICSAADGSGELQRLSIPDFISLSTSDPTKLECNWPKADGSVASPADQAVTRELQCDTMGRTRTRTGVLVTDPTIGLTSVVLTVTHKDMLDGSLTPKIRHNVQVFGLWQIRDDRVMY